MAGGVLVGLGRRQIPVQLLSGWMGVKRVQMPRLGFPRVNVESMQGRFITTREKMAKRDKRSESKVRLSCPAYQPPPLMSLSGL